MDVVQGTQRAEIVEGVLQLLGVEAEALVEALEALSTGLLHCGRVVGLGHCVEQLGLGPGLLADLLGSVLDVTHLKSSKRCCLFVDCSTSQQHAGVSQKWICLDNWTCCHTKIKLSISPSHSILAPGQPVPALTLYHQASGRVATGVPIFRSLVQLNPEKSPRKSRTETQVSPLEVNTLTTGPNKAVILSKMLRVLRNFLNTDRPQHNSTEGNRSGERKQPTFHPLRSGMNCVQQDKHWRCFEGNLGPTAERWCGVCMGLFECYDAILSRN